MPLVTTRAGASSFGLGWGAAAGEEELGGMVLVEPTSVSYTGTSASIGANGTTTFSGCSSLRINGAFDATYDNYLVSMIVKDDSLSGNTIRMNLSKNGSDNTSTYYLQAYVGQGTSFYGQRNTSTLTNVMNIGNQISGGAIYMYGPYKNQKTAGRIISAVSANNGEITDGSMISTAVDTFDGFRIFLSSSTFSGTVSIYGLVGA